MQTNMPRLEGKNLTILEDQMKHEAQAARKSRYIAGEFTDPNLKTLASGLAQHHQQSFERLFQYLSSHQ